MEVFLQIFIVHNKSTILIAIVKCRLQVHLEIYYGLILNKLSVGPLAVEVLDGCSVTEL